MIRNNKSKIFINSDLLRYSLCQENGYKITSKDREILYVMQKHTNNLFNKKIKISSLNHSPHLGNKFT